MKHAAVIAFFAAVFALVLAFSGALTGCSHEKPAAPGDPVLAVEPDTLAFEAVEVDSSRSLTLTVRNAGGGTLAGTVGGDAPPVYVISEGAGAYSLRAGEERRVRVVFTPDSVGAFACTLRVADGSRGRVPCAGEGVLFDRIPPARITDLSLVVLSPGSARLAWHAAGDDGSQGTAARIEIRAFTGDSAAFRWNDAAPLHDNPVPLEAGRLQTAIADSLPLDAPIALALVTIDDAGNISAVSNAVSAEVPIEAVDPPNVDFGVLAPDSSAVRNVTVRNDGRGVFRIDVGTLETGFEEISGADSVALRSGQSRELSVRFAPPATGDWVGSIPPTGVPLIRLRGRCAVIQRLTAAPNPLLFGAVAPGETRDLRVLIRNEGNVVLDGTLVASPPFLLPFFPSSYHLVPSEQEWFTVRFAPSDDHLALGTIDTGYGPVECIGQNGANTEELACREGNLVVQPSPDGDPCSGSTLFLNTDGSFEAGGAWQGLAFSGESGGAFAEGYNATGLVCGISIVTIATSAWADLPIDAFVWDSDEGNPGNVLSVTHDVHLVPPPLWPMASQQELPIAPVHVMGDFFIGYRGVWPSREAPFLLGIDRDGFGGLPYTNIPEGIGSLAGWRDGSYAFGPLVSFGIGAYVR